jgi:predicted O-methyltransferase YrrM
VVSVEHDVEFLELMEPLLAQSPGHGRVLGRTLDAGPGDSHAHRYVGAIDEIPGDFDLIVVDGRERVRCVEAAIPRLAAGGVVLLDDSQRRRYRPALTTPGTVVTEFRGLVPTLPLPRRTALIRRAG